MLYAYSDIGQKIRATPNAIAACPECGEGVMAKCGEINIWHWAHKRRGDCDIWGECETQWHLTWKSYFPAECVEISIGGNGTKHRADIRTPNGIVIELQHSPISVEKIREREQFYGNMIWIFDVREPHSAERLYFRNKGDFHTFRWEHARKSLAFARAESLWDFGAMQLFNMKKMYTDAPHGGWGKLVDIDYFIQQHGGQYYLRE